ncbi:MAG TPA: hypothetical protein VFI31_11655 [Pirellulales bacterium]|nr:hypothetical protein [Pirellulales bacterium]
MGQPDNERDLLMAFWHRFSESVAPEKCLDVADQVKRLLLKEAKFFQDAVDSGELGLSQHGPRKKTKKDEGEVEFFRRYLKPELRKLYYWPKYSAIWPFNKQMRETMGRVDRSRPEFNEEWFDRVLLPSYPHDYMQFLTKEISVLRPTERNSVETFRLRLSIARYYGRLVDRPDRVEKDLFQFNHRVLRDLHSVNPDAWGAALLREAIAFLDLIGKTNADADLRDRANELLLKYLDQLKRTDDGGGAAKHVQGDRSDVGSPPAGVRFDLFRRARAGIAGLIREA